MSHSDPEHPPNRWKQGQLCIGQDIDVIRGKLISASDSWAIGVQGKFDQDYRNLS